MRMSELFSAIDGIIGCQSALEWQDQLCSDQPSHFHFCRIKKKKHKSSGVASDFALRPGDFQVETIWRTHHALGNYSMRFMHIKKWYNRFKDGRTSGRMEHVLVRAQRVDMTRSLTKFGLRLCRIFVLFIYFFLKTTIIWVFLQFNCISVYYVQQRH